jgi:cytochrome c oxidase subunit 1
LWSLNAGKVATANPWEANTLEWSTTSPPPHDNFTITPTVYRGPYEYSSPEAAEDWLPQDRELIKSSKAAGS